MEFRFSCSSCGQKLKAEEEHAGRRVDCPHCGAEFCVPQPEPELPSSPAEPPRDCAFATPNLDGALTCPVCWLRFDTGDIMHLAVDVPSRGTLHPRRREDRRNRTHLSPKFVLSMSNPFFAVSYTHLTLPTKR